MNLAALAEGRTQLDLAFAPDARGDTVVTRRRLRYPFVLTGSFRPEGASRGLLKVILQSGSGGLFAGERLCQRIALAPGAAVQVTTQASSVVHRMAGGEGAEQRVRIAVDRGAHLEYLPAPAILFPGSALSQRIELTVDRHAAAILADGFLTHDPAGSGGGFRFLDFEIVVREPGAAAPLAIDRARLAGAIFAAQSGIGSGYHAYGSLIAVAPAGRDIGGLLRRLREQVEGLPKVYAGVSSLPGGRGIAAKFLARDGGALQSALACAGRSLRDLLRGPPAAA